MADTTTHGEKRSRSETASLLRSVADELDSGRGQVRVPIGNKEVQLSPPEQIDSEVTVTERSRRLRKDTEELALTFRWSPTGAGDDEANDANDGETGANR